MKKGQDTFQGMIIVLALICAAAGLGLGATYRATRHRIEAQLLRDRMAALRIVLPQAHKDGFREVTVPQSAFAADGKYYQAYDKAVADPSGKLVGYALEAAGQGYSSTIRITVGVDPQANVIRGIKITFQQETPGLGAKCEEVKTDQTLWDVLLGRRRDVARREPWFQAQFAGQTYHSLVKTGNNYENIDGLTGATITTNAVADAAVAAIKEFREKISPP